MPVSPADSLLEHLREGKTDSLYINGLIDPVTFYEVLDGIREAPTVHRLRFAASGFDKDDLEQLLEVASLHPELKELEISNAPFDGKSIQHLINALPHFENLEILKLNNCGMKDDAMQPLTEWVANQDGLRSLELRGNNWSQEAHDRLAWALRDKNSLVRLNTQHDAPKKDDHAFETALLQNPHPNFFMSDFQSKPLTTLTGHNHRYMTKAETMLETVIGLGKQDYESVAARMKPEFVFNAENHRDIIAYRQQNNPFYHKTYDAFTAAMPKLEEGKPITLASLMQPDKTGLTPLENPHVWRENPDILATLLKNGELTKENRDATTPRGTKVLEAALAYTPTKKVLATLNGAGITIRQSSLFHEDGKPQRLTEILSMKGEIASLFTLENWSGAPLDAPKRLRDALDAPAQQQVPPLNTLTYQMRLAESERNRGNIGR